jgi:hypothetical protein
LQILGNIFFKGQFLGDPLAMQVGVPGRERDRGSGLERENQRAVSFGKIDRVPIMALAARSMEMGESVLWEKGAVYGREL